MLFRSYPKHPKDVIRFPDRYAKQIRNSFELSQLDGVGMMEHEQHELQTMKETEKANALRKVARQANDTSHVELKAHVKKLAQARSKRPKPLRDDKVIVSWNALMIKALARASKALSNRDYLKASQRAATFILSNMRTQKMLYHNSRLGQNGVPGYLEDYAFLANSLLDLFKIDGQENWVAEAQKLVKEARQLFYDKKSGAYFRNSLNHDKLLIREIDKADNVIPSGAGVLADTLFQLYRLTKDKVFLKEAHQLLKVYHSELMHSPMQTISFMDPLLNLYETFNSSQKPLTPGLKSNPEITMESFPLIVKARKDQSKQLIFLQIGRAHV